MTARITVCSLRDRGEPQARDVVCTRPGPWGNPYTVERYGWRALDLYRRDLVQALTNGWGGPAGVAFRVAVAHLADARLLCACPAESLACHAWILAEEVDRLTGCGVEPAPERQTGGAR